MYRNTQHQILWNNSGSAASKHQRSSSKKKKKSKKQDKKEGQERSNEEPVTPEHQVLLQVSPDESPCVQDVDARDLLFVSIKRTSRRQSHSSLKKSEPAMKRNSLDDISYENGHKSPFQISVFRCIEELNNRSSETYSELKFTPFDRLSKEEIEEENRKDRNQEDRKDRTDGNESPKASKTSKEEEEEKTEEEEDEDEKPEILFTRKFEIRCQHVWMKAIRCLECKNKCT